MESSSKDKFCNDCKSFKSSSEFTSYGTNRIKQLKTCKNCRQRFEKKRKALMEIKNCQPTNTVSLKWDPDT